MLTPDQKLFIDSLVDRLGPTVSEMVDAACTSRMQRASGAMQSQAAASAAFNTSYAAATSMPALPGGSTGQYPIPGPGCSGGAIPSSYGSWCPIKCDPCLFSNLALDMELFSWPQIENQLWDTDTKLNNLVVGAFPLVPGASLTLSQETDRTIGFVPDCVQISTTWDNTPQPGLLSYQWQVTMQNNLTSGAVQFSNVQLGNQYECGTNCLTLSFPAYKGCKGFPIGSQSALQLVVSLSAAATSNVTGIDVIVYHRKGSSQCCSVASQAVSSCGGGGCGCK